MRNATADQSQLVPVDLDAETEELRGSEASDDSALSSGDPIPNNFMGVPDVPEHEGSTSDSEVSHSTFNFIFLFSFHQNVLVKCSFYSHSTTCKMFFQLYISNVVKFKIKPTKST